MPTLTPFLTYNGNAEEAVRHYLSIFEDGKITSTMPGPDGKPMGLPFDLLGQSFQALNGGPTFVFSCGWLVDKFGVSWQIIPRRLMDLFSDKDRTKANRAIAAMLKMTKLDIAGLDKAFNGDLATATDLRGRGWGALRG